MNNSTQVAYKEYIIDTETLCYKAVWNCQVEWTDECIFYDAETGTLVLENDEPEFISAHPIKVTKAEYLHHAQEASSLRQVTSGEIKEILLGPVVIQRKIVTRKETPGYPLSLKY